MSDTRFIDGMFELVDSYDGFILDQWGVIHDGHKLYPGVTDVLTHLKARKKQVVILSNSAKRSDYNGDRMKKLGLKAGSFKTVLSAGEVTWQGLKNKAEAPFKGLGDNCYLIARGDDRALLEGLGINLVDNIEDANYILLTGVDAPEKTMEDYDPILKKAVAKGLPLICANPDFITIFGNERHMGPGAVAKRYNEFGGVSHMIGKPHKLIFRHALKLFDGIIPSRVVVIGDSLQHDIAGAIASDLDSAFVTQGVHAGAFKAAGSPELKRKVMEQMVQNYGVRPNWVLESMIWQTKEAANRQRERERFKD